MKRILLFSLLFFFFTSVWAQSFWRPDEGRIKISSDLQQAIHTLKQHQLPYFHNSHGEIYLYAIPREMELIKSAGIDFIVEIEDMAAYAQTFWQQKEEYHTYDEIIAEMDMLASTYSNICTKIDYGTSVQGRELAALKISDNPTTDENEAEVMFDGGIHGDEIGGPENLIRFANYLCESYGTDPDITGLINNREIWLYVMVNPDGRVNMSRQNANGVDLNRDAGYMWDGWGSSPGPFSQIESKALRECMYNNQFVVHTTYHSGTEYISCPWSYRSSPPPDEDHILELAGVYSSTSTYSNMEYGQGNTGMYAINGSTKDTNYGMMGSISWSMEISYDKQPPTSQILLYYNHNVPAMLEMIERAGHGLEGTVTDANTGDPIEAIVFVNDYMPTYSDATAGDYHKYVLPGTYSITVKANGYEPLTIDNVSVTAGTATVTDFQLQPVASGSGQYAYKISMSQIPENNPNDEGATPAALHAPDDVNYSIGKNGWVVLDMQTPVIDGPGTDLIVYEGDDSPEGYTCFAAQSPDGPWTMVGQGTGTTEFDFMGAVAEAQFIKILDDGDGNSQSADAGFDLDAMEAPEHVSGVYISMVSCVIDDSNGNNNGRIDPGETVDVNITLRNNGDITATNTESTLSTTDGFLSITSGTASFGTLTQGQESEATFSMQADEATPIGHVAAVALDVEANSGNYTNSFDLNFTIGLIVAGFEEELSSLPWTTGGEQPWEIVITDPYEGTYCMKSGAITDEQTSEIAVEYEVNGSGEISFARKVSSESSYDYLQFYIDNTLVEEWSGEMTWDEVVFPVTPGSHTFKWVYEKDYTVSSGSDCAWIDYIIFPSGAFVNFVPQFTSTAITAAKEGVEYTYQVTATDLNPFDIITISCPTKPEWLSFEENGDGTALLSGMPGSGDIGQHEVVLQVTDGRDVSSQEFTITVEANGVPYFESQPLTEVEVGADYYYHVEATDDDPNSTLTLTAATLPEWLSFSDTGNGTALISGTAPSATGTYQVSLEVTDGIIEEPVIQDFEISVQNQSAIDTPDTSDEIQLYPNPNDGLFTLALGKWQQLSETQIIIINLKGEEIYSGLLETGQNTKHIDLSHLAKGVYIVKVTNGEQTYTEQFIIE